MPVPFKQIPLDAALPGMTLSDDLLDHTGNILLREGMVLTASMLASLRRHDVETVAITCADAEAPDPAAATARHAQRLASLFRKPDDAGEDATALLRQLVRRYRLGDAA